MTLQCTKCKQIKPDEEFNFSKGREHRRGRFQWCKACVSVNNHKWRTEHREEVRTYLKAYWKNNTNNTQESHRLACLRRGNKARVVIRERYGKVCACCGEAQSEFLTLDHIDGKGAAQRRELKHQGNGVQFYFWLIRQGLPDGYRTLCFNCNSSAGTTGICAHSQLDALSFVGACG